MSASPGSSSTRSTVRVCACRRGPKPSMSRTPLWSYGQGEPERRPARHLGVEPDPAAVMLHGLATQRQSDAGPLVGLLGMQALEDGEDALGVLGVYADPLVAAGDRPGRVVARGGHVDDRRVVAVELQGVADEVLQDGDEEDGIAVDDR